METYHLSESGSEDVREAYSDFSSEQEEKYNKTYTHLDFAAEVGCSRTIISNFINKKPVESKLFIRICKKLKIDWRKVRELDNLPKHISKSKKIIHKNVSTTQKVESSTQDNKKNPLLASPHTESFRYVIEDKIKDFIGREFVFKDFESFTKEHDRGYFTVVGDPGEGKSSIAAHYASNNPCLYYFNIRSDGQDTAQQFLNSICSQIIEFSHHDIHHDETDIKDGKLFKHLLIKVSDLFLSKQEKLIIVIDALDEVELSSQKSSANLLYLPKNLPPNIYFFLTRRRDTLLLPKLRFETPEKVLDLLNYPHDTEKDVKDYLNFYLDKNNKLSQKLNLWIGKQKGLDRNDFISVMIDKSEKNFMYLRYILPQIANGFYQSLKITQLPEGLEKYYEDHWERMGMNATPRPRRKIDIIYILTKIRRPVSCSKIAEFASTNEYTVKQFEVQEIIDNWEQFLRTVLIEHIKRHKIYHLSFNDFLHRKDITQAAGVTISEIHGMITDTLLDGLEDEDEDENDEEDE